MSTWSSRQLAAIGAFGVVPLWIIGFFLAGKPPKFAGSPQSVVDYYANHQLAAYMRERGQWTLAAVVLVGGAAKRRAVRSRQRGVRHGLRGCCTAGDRSQAGEGALRTRPVRGHPDVLARAADHRVGRDRRGTGLFPPWSVWLSGLFAVLVLPGGLCVKADGAFSPTGVIANLAFAAAVVFLLEVGLLLWGASEREPQMTA